MGLFGPGRPRGLRADAVRGQRSWWLLACVAAIVMASFAPLATLASGGRIAVMDLMSDPVEVTGAVWYIGAVSDLNLLLWAAGAAVLLVAAVGLRRVDGALSVALGWLAALTTVVALDDRFLLHEIVLPSLLGIPETATYAFYAVVLVSILVRYGRVLLDQPEASTLLLAVGALGVSVALDVVGWDLAARRVAEETAKLLGTLAWGLFAAAIVVRYLDRTGPRASTGGSASTIPRG